MRLKDSEIAAIRSTVQDLDKDAQIYLFGSRVDDGKKGGDIDLLIMSARLVREDRRVIRMRLYELIGEQKIDIVIACDDADPFVKLALESGVRL